jgi:hypothetical protein
LAVATNDDIEATGMPSLGGPMVRGFALFAVTAFAVAVAIAFGSLSHRRNTARCLLVAAEVATTIWLAATTAGG